MRICKEAENLTDSFRKQNNQLLPPAIWFNKVGMHQRQKMQTELNAEKSMLPISGELPFLVKKLTKKGRKFTFFFFTCLPMSTK